MAYFSIYLYTTLGAKILTGHPIQEGDAAELNRLCIQLRVGMSKEVRATAPSKDEWKERGVLLRKDGRLAPPCNSIRGVWTDFST